MVFSSPRTFTLGFIMYCDLSKTFLHVAILYVWLIPNMSSCIYKENTLAYVCLLNVGKLICCNIMLTSNRFKGMFVGTV